MPLQIRPTIQPRERILGFGVAGTGKSHALLTIARKCPDNTFHVLDNDLAYERLLATDFTDLANVRVYNVLGEGAEGWEEHLSVAREIVGTMDRDDWAVIDSTSPTWSVVQEWFTERVFSQDIADYFLQVRMQKQESKEKKKSLGALEGWYDWPVINKEYRKLQNLIINCPGHIYCTAELQAISSDDNDKDVKGIFGPYGVKPVGQKRMGHLFQTVVMFGKNRAGEYSMTTVKDRGREEMEGREVEDFARDYLMRVAGWKPGRAGA